MRDKNRLFSFLIVVIAPLVLVIVAVNPYPQNIILLGISLASVVVATAIGWLAFNASNHSEDLATQPKYWRATSGEPVDQLEGWVGGGGDKQRQLNLGGQGGAC